jgi:hypothetical protein
LLPPIDSQARTHTFLLMHPLLIAHKNRACRKAVGSRCTRPSSRSKKVGVLLVARQINLLFSPSISPVVASRTYVVWWLWCRADAAGVHIPAAQRRPGRHAEDLRR